MERERRSIPIECDTNSDYYQEAFYIGKGNTLELKNESEKKDFDFQLDWNRKLKVIAIYLKRQEQNDKKLMICFETINTLLNLQKSFNISHLDKENKLLLFQILVELLKELLKKKETENLFLYLSELLFNRQYLENYLDYNTNQKYEGIDQSTLGLLRTKYHYLSSIKKAEEKRK